MAKYLKLAHGPTDGPTNWRTGLPTYLPNYLPTYLPTYKNAEFSPLVLAMGCPQERRLFCSLTYIFVYKFGFIFFYYDIVVL